MQKESDSFMLGASWTRLGRLLGGGLLLALLLTAVGCGSSSATVSGKITYKSTPLRGGTVTFFGPTEGSWTQTSNIGEDGGYSVAKMPAGIARISVETDTVKPNQTGMQMASKMPKIPEGIEHSPFGQAPRADKYVEIPKKYNKPETSGLTYEVKSGKQDHDLKLE